MSRLIVLGASNALASERSANTHMVIETPQRLLLIDAVDNPVVRLRQAGFDAPRTLTDVILTHFHPDHVGGFPTLLMDMWLLGRTQPLHVYGLQDTLMRVNKMLALYDWHTWPNFYEVHFHSLAEKPELVPILDASDVLVQAAAVKHIVPTIGLRVTFKDSKKIWAYSCDTEPCEAAVTLGGGADVFFHEASGDKYGHSSAAQAASIARRAEVGALYLIHYDTQQDRDDALRREAEAVFGAPVYLAKDFMTLDF